MRSMERNKIELWYSLYSNKAPILNELGQETGEYTSGYLNPVKTKARVSPNRGESQVEAFGIMIDYDRTIVTTDNLPLDEKSIVWIETTPELEEDGSTATPYDYDVKKVAKDLNVNQFAIKKRVS